MRTLSPKFWILPPLALGVLAIFVAPMFKSGPQKAPIVERAAKVRVIKTPSLDVVPRAIGYGTMQAGRVWSAVAQVAGPVVWVSAQLENGKLVRAGEELLRIDEASYRLNLAQIDAQLRASDVKAKTTRASLAIAVREHKILSDEHNRKKALSAKGAVSKSSLEAAERQMLSGEAQVQNLKNTLSINAADREVLSSQRSLAELDLSHTLIAAPYDARITEVSADLAQFANKGQLLFQADGTDVAEVEAQFPIGSLRPLIISRLVGVDTAAQSSTQAARGLEAMIRLNAGTHIVETKATVTRVSGTIDPQTQSVGIVVSISDPYKKARPGQRPPMIQGTFVEVELKGAAIPNQVVVPAQAVRQGKVYVVGDDSRLMIVPVTVAFTQGGFSVIAGGLEPGTALVVTDLIPAVEGMLLKPMDDQKTRMKLVVEATGQKSAQSRLDQK